MWDPHVSEEKYGVNNPSQQFPLFLFLFYSFGFIFAADGVAAVRGRRQAERPHRRASEAAECRQRQAAGERDGSGRVAPLGREVQRGLGHGVMGGGEQRLRDREEHQLRQAAAPGAGGVCENGIFRFIDLSYVPYLCFLDEESTHSVKK